MGTGYRLELNAPVHFRGDSFRGGSEHTHSMEAHYNECCLLLLIGELGLQEWRRPGTIRETIAE